MGDGLGEVASAAGDAANEGGEVASTAGGAAASGDAAAGGAAPVDIAFFFAVSALILSNCSGDIARIFPLFAASIFILGSSSRRCLRPCSILSLCACTCPGSGIRA